MILVHAHEWELVQDIIFLFVFYNYIHLIEPTTNERSREWARNESKEKVIIFFAMAAHNKTTSHRLISR